MLDVVNKMVFYATNWFSNLGIGDIVAIFLVLFSVSFAFSTVKVVFKVGLVVIGFLAVLYLTAPELYDVAADVGQRFWADAQRIVGQYLSTTL